MRARSAVSLPSASQPTVRSMRIGWRFGWMRSDSSRESVHFTGASSRNAASAVCAWFAHVLLAAERAAVRHQLDGDALRRRCRAPTRSGRGRPTRPDRRSTRASGRRPRAPRASTPARGTRARCAGSGTRRARRARSRRARRRRRRARTPSATARCRRAPTPRRRRRRARRPGSVIGAQRRGTRPRRARRRARAVVAVVGDDEREHVAEVRGAPALGDEDRPVLVDQADAQRAGHVGRGEHAHDAGHRRRGASCRCASTSARAWSARWTAPCSMPSTRRSSTYGLSPSARSKPW